MQRVLRDRYLRSFFLFITILALSRTTLGTTVVVQTDDEMITQARAIVMGKVLSVASAFDDQHEHIYTYTTLKVSDVLKGEITSRRIVIKEAGGLVGTTGSLVFGTPQFVPGERVIVYLDTWADGSLRVHQMFLGKFTISDDPVTGERIATRGGPDSGTSILPASDQSRGAITDRMEVSAYLRMVRDRLDANLIQAREFETKYYTGVPLLKEPAEYQAKSSRGEIQPQYHLWIPPIRWFEPDTGQQVLFYTNPDSAPTPTTVNDVAAAMTAWSSVANCSLRVGSGGNTGGCGLFTLDGQNTVSFNNCDGYFGPGSSGILAVASIANYTTSTTKVVGGVTFYKALEGNISFNPFSSSFFGDHCNVQEITTHEMGHSLGLHHSWDPSFGGSASASDLAATMYYIAHFDGRCASLRTDDVNGITAIYPASGGGGGPLSITSTSPLAAGTVNSAYSQSLAATGGTLPYTWSLATGSGPLPTGLTISSGGVISGTPTATGTFNFTVQVRDSAATPQTATKALSITINSAGTAFNSQFVTQTVPTTVQPGASFNATIVWTNTGTQTWDGSAGFRLGSQNPANNTTWGGNAVNLPGFVIAPGSQLNLTFTAFAPTTPGTYNFQWQTVQNNAFFGQPSANVVITVGSPSTDNAGFVSQSVSTSMTAGQSSAVSITMQNTGNTTWTAGTYFLGSQNPQDNTTWGLNRVSLASSVAPGSNAVFSFTVTAPAAGTYNFQWQMFKNGSGFFGAMSTNVVITVQSGGGGSGPYNAAFSSQSVPSTMNPGQSYSVSVTFTNTGTTAWSAGTGFKFVSQNPANNTTWGLNQIALNKFVNIGSSYTFLFGVTAPLTPGSYNFQWQMWKDGVGFFGAPSTNVVVQVGGAPAIDDATFVSQTVPSTMTVGQLSSVSVTMHNAGTTTWSAGSGYHLGSQNPQDNITWGLNRVNLPGSVAPGGNVTFTFNVTAPNSAATYNFQWKMQKDGAGFFGSASTNVAVSVTSGAPPPTDDASFVSQTVATSMNTGEIAPVSVTMHNSGNTTWTAGTFSLAPVGPNSTAWGVSLVNLPASVAPNTNVMFSFNVTAPSTGGTYAFQWRMQKSGSGLFGLASTSVSVNVSGGVSPLVLTTTSLPYGQANQAYSAQCTATGGTLPYTWSMTGAPPGLTIDGNGLIRGTPTLSGTFYINVTVRDTSGQSQTKQFKTFFR